MLDLEAVLSGELRGNMIEAAHQIEQDLKTSPAVSTSVLFRRLEPRGVGPLAQAATNRTEEGRAMNRRVVLVER